MIVCVSVYVYLSLTVLFVCKRKSQLETERDTDRKTMLDSETGSERKPLRAYETGMVAGVYNCMRFVS